MRLTRIFAAEPQIGGQHLQLLGNLVDVIGKSAQNAASAAPLPAADMTKVSLCTSKPTSRIAPVDQRSRCDSEKSIVPSHEARKFNPCFW